MSTIEGHDLGNTQANRLRRQNCPAGHKEGMYHEVSASKPVPLWLLLPILVVVIAAVIGDPGGRQKAPAAAAEAPSDRAGRCVPVAHAFVVHLMSRTATGAAPRVEVVRASAYVGAASSYFVAAEFSAADGTTRTGVWVSRSLESGERWIYSADGFARGMTTWPDASSRGPLMQPADPRIDFARQCMATGEYRTR
jgi:hypothetical protein